MIHGQQQLYLLSMDLLTGTTNVGALSLTRANDMAVAEIILIYGEPSASEWAEFKDHM
jgi:hypothetical protein